jgi:hypothetical protein
VRKDKKKHNLFFYWENGKFSFMLLGALKNFVELPVYSPVSMLNRRGRPA